MRIHLLFQRSLGTTQWCSFLMRIHLLFQRGQGPPLFLQLCLCGTQPLFDVAKFRLQPWVVGQAVTDTMVGTDGFGRLAGTDT